ncbi:MAG: signal recognition particle protein Srp19 [Candidatus Odinarchaeum yellowstonii]|uniref:Signal recognition particle 19 kDa protein n=1 Tax=Odinarchaeota yellowstonii (strain LCB_4) TaxID=1841599 RepID=A0AAF0IB00_ODILC|nr:MAG: signal recognition particle protein Srp19 [Candidatus Odinarchaeum yellowstonii]
MKKRDFIIIWPQYFDKAFSRARGRRVPLKYAVMNPSLSDLIKAASTLGYSFEVDREARYPACWWIESGRLLIKKTASKSEIIKNIYKILAR